MKNLILKQGDFVRVNALTGPIEAAGLSIGAVCQVEACAASGRLLIQGPKSRVGLTDLSGELTDACDAVSIARGVAVLPRGLGGVSAR